MSRYKYLVFGALLFIMIGVRAVAEPAPAVALGTSAFSSHLRLTSDQAVLIAKDFCRKASGSANMNGIAQCTAPDPFPRSPEHHWQAHWRVTFPNQAEVEVIDATGVVAFYDNLNYAAKNPAVGSQPAGQPISKEAAMLRAADLLAATGQTGELAFWKADLDQTTEPPTVLGHTWFVCWTRQFQGIPYEHEGLNITLDAETGEARGLGLVFHSAPPLTAAISIDQQAAQRIALAVLERLGVEAPQFTGCKHLVVQPNRYWQVGGEPISALPETARPVWSCLYAVGPRVYKVWVDTETGKIAGGAGSVRKIGDPLSLLFSKPVSAQ